MQTLTRLAAAAALATLAGTGFAQEGVQDSTWITPSTLSRAEVRAGAHDAGTAGSEASFTVAATRSGSGLTRAQVQAEAREALRLGLLPQHEAGMSAATPAQQEQIRQAGQRAVEAGSRVASR